MLCIGAICENKRSLIPVVQECIALGLKQVKPWGFLGDMGQAIHEHVLKNGYSLVKEIGGTWNLIRIS